MTTSSSLVGLFIALCVIGLTVGLMTCRGDLNRQPESRRDLLLTTEHRNAIQKQLKSSGYPMPNSLEINDSGWLVATYELKGAVSELSLRTYAEDSIMAIREAMLPFKVVDKYRVTLNGPSPGTGMIRRYGSARFIEGGRVEWQSGI